MPKSLAPPAMAGFTLIEVLVVLFIIGLVLSLTLPRLQNPSRDAQLFAVQLAALINDAASLARTQERAVNVNFDCVSQHYTTVDDTTVAVPETKALAQPAGLSVQPMTPSVCQARGSQAYPVAAFNEVGKNLSPVTLRVFHTPDASGTADATILPLPYGAQVGP